MTAKHRDPVPAARDRWTITALAAAAAVLTAASVHGIVTTPSTPNVNTSIGHGTADVPVVATKSRVPAPQPFPDTQGTPAPETTTTGHTEEQP